MATLKVRNIGSSVGVIFPKEIGLKVGDELPYQKQGMKLILDMEELDKAHDRALIEEGFADFEKGLIVSKEEMKVVFGKYGWK